MFNETILKLTKRLYPKGRAFRIPFGSVIEKVHKGLNSSESRAYSDAISVLDSILPDNANFTTEDASDWERRLGLITNTTVPLEDRKAAILRKMNHPGTIPARQHYLYLERELRAANFDVRVYENRNIAALTDPPESGVAEMGVSEMGGYVGLEFTTVYDPNDFITEADQMGIGESGVAEMGGASGTNDFEICARYIDSEKDANFFNHQFVDQMGASESGVAEMGSVYDFPTALRSSFFIGGDTLGSFAEIQANRKDELRQLILKIKPNQTVALLFLTFAGPDFNDDFNDDFNV